MTREEVITIAKNLIVEHNLKSLRALTKFNITEHEIYRKYKLHKEGIIQEVITRNKFGWDVEDTKAVEAKKGKPHNIAKPNPKKILVEKAIKLITKHKLTSFAALVREGISEGFVYRKYKLHEMKELQDLMQQNAESAETRSKELVDENGKIIVENLKKQALIILKANPLVFRQDFLCNHLHISLATFFRYGFNQDIDILTALDYNKIQIKQKKYSDLLKNTDPSSISMSLKLTGTEEERMKISTNYQQVKSENHNTISGNVNITRLTDAELSMRIKELEDRLK